MRYTLENEDLRIEADSFGAELKSVKNVKTGRDYLWNGDRKYWGRTSPVLFPFVGSVQHKEYILNGKTYPMGQHGFARDMEHELASQTKDTLWFLLKSSGETLAKYPFAFELKIGYQLSGNSVKVLWEVVNPADETLPFSIGAHPAFLCPIGGEDDKTGYRIAFGRFERNTAGKDPADAERIPMVAGKSCNTFRTARNGQAESEPADGPTSSWSLKKTVVDAAQPVSPCTEIHHHGNTRDTGLAVTEDITLPLENGSCEITPGFFDRCTYMIEGNQANSVSLIDKEGNAYVTVLFDTPLFAIWSPEGKNAPFVCIEPWYGRCDHVDFHGELAEREYTHLLKAGKAFHAEYVMKFA